MRRIGAIAAALTLSASLAHAQQSAGEIVDDAVLHTRVKAAIVQQDVLSGLGMNIETHKGIVQLGGFVDDAATVSKALTTVSAVKGVREVDSQLHPRPAARSAGQALDDGLALVRINQSLAGISLGSAWSVNVDVYGGVVLLTGFVDSAETKKRAGELASSDKNTKAVINGLHVAR